MHCVLASAFGPGGLERRKTADDGESGEVCDCDFSAFLSQSSFKVRKSHNHNDKQIEDFKFSSGIPSSILGKSQNGNCNKSKIFISNSNSSTDFESKTSQSTCNLFSSGRVSGCVDSASTHVISRVRNDFKSLSKVANVKMRGCGGSLPGGKVAYTGLLKPNTLGLCNAVYFDKLPVDRILAVCELNKSGLSVLLTAESPKLVHSQLGSEFPVYYEGGLPYVDFEFDQSETEYCEPCEDSDASALLSRLVQHRRLAHLQCSDLPKVKCPDCDVSKGSKAGADKVRDEKYEEAEPLRQLNTDFYGPLPVESVRGAKLILVFICDAIAHTWVFPIRHRSECTQVVKDLIARIRAQDSGNSMEKGCPCSA